MSTISSSATVAPTSTTAAKPTSSGKTSKKISKVAKKSSTTRAIKLKKKSSSSTKLLDGPSSSNHQRNDGSSTKLHSPRGKRTSGAPPTSPRNSVRSPSHQRPLSPSQQRAMDKLSQPKRKRNKRFKLQKSHSKSGFGSGSTRDLFFGFVPADGAKKQYLKHDSLEKKNGAQSAFKSKSFITSRVPFNTKSETTNVELQHSKDIIDHHEDPNHHQKSAPFGTGEEKFKIYDYYHNSKGTDEMMGPGSYFPTDPELPSSRRTSGNFIDLDQEAAAHRHPNSLFFQHQHKNFRSTNDLHTIAALRKGKNSNHASHNSRPGATKKRGIAQSTAQLPLHLIRQSSLTKHSGGGSSNSSSRSNSRKKKLLKRTKKKVSSREASEHPESAPITPITPLTPTSESEGQDSHSFL